MLKERIQEIFDFTKSESPYKKANKGWISPDIFLDLNPSANTTKQNNESAKITLFWTPISSLLSNIFIIIVVGSILVFTSASFSKGRFDFTLFNKFTIKDIAKVEENKDTNISLFEDIDNTKPIIQQKFEIEDLDKINSLDYDSPESDQKIINQIIDNQDILIEEDQSKKDIKIVQNKKLKSNFI